MLHILISLLVGAAAGYIASSLMKADNSNIIFNCALGIGGGIVGNIVGGLIQVGPTGYIGSLIFSVIGACIVIWVYRKFIKK